MQYLIEKLYDNYDTDYFGDRDVEIIGYEFSTQIARKLREQIKLVKEPAGENITLYKTELHVFTKEEFEEIADALRYIRRLGDYDANTYVAEIENVLGLTK